MCHLVAAIQCDEDILTVLNRVQLQANIARRSHGRGPNVYSPVSLLMRHPNHAGVSSNVLKEKLKFFLFRRFEFVMTCIDWLKSEVTRRMPKGTTEISKLFNKVFIRKIIYMPVF